MRRGEDEQPWFPGPELPWQFVLTNPEGTRHLAFDHQRGGWLRVFRDGSSKPLRPSEAVLLRPSDVDTIIKWTVAWGLEGGRGNRAQELVDDLAAGVKAAILYFADRAGHR
jgi:hypothetical protein